LTFLTLFPLTRGNASVAASPPILASRVWSSASATAKCDLTILRARYRTSAESAAAKKRAPKVVLDADAAISIQVVAAPIEAPARFRRGDESAVPNHGYLLSCGHVFDKIDAKSESHVLICSVCGLRTAPNHRAREADLADDKWHGDANGDYRHKHATTSLTALHDLSQPPRCAGRFEKCKRPATVQCNGKNCGRRPLCNECFDDHITPGERKCAEPGDIERFHPRGTLQPEHCPTHDRAPLIGYCPTLRCLVCATCNGETTHRECHESHLLGDKATAFATKVHERRSKAVFALVRDLEEAVEATEGALQQNAAEFNELLRRLNRERDEAKAAIDEQHEAILRQVHQHAFKTNAIVGFKRLAELDAARDRTAELAAELMVRDARGPLSSLELAQELTAKAFSVRAWSRQPRLVQYTAPQDVWRCTSRGGAAKPVGDALREDFREVNPKEPTAGGGGANRNATEASSRNGRRQRAGGPWAARSTTPAPPPDTIPTATTETRSARPLTAPACPPTFDLQRARLSSWCQRSAGCAMIHLAREKLAKRCESQPCVCHLHSGSASEDPSDTPNLRHVSRRK